MEVRFERKPTVQQPSETELEALGFSDPRWRRLSCGSRAILDRQTRPETLGTRGTAGIRFCDVTVAGQQSLPSGCLACSASSMKRSGAGAVFCVVLTRKMSFTYTLILFFCGQDFVP